MSESLFRKMGGSAAIDTAVDIFYKKVLSDDLLARFFRGVDLENQIKSQKSFLTLAFGGPNNYSGRDVREGHARLVKERGLSDVHFDAILSHLVSTLVELNIPDEPVAECTAIVERMRADVLNRR